MSTLLSQKVIQFNHAPIQNVDGGDEFPDVTVSVAGLQVNRNGDDEYTIIEIGPKNTGRGRDQPLDKHQETKKYLEEKQKQLEKQTTGER